MGLDGGAERYGRHLSIEGGREGKTRLKAGPGRTTGVSPWDDRPVIRGTKIENDTGSSTRTMDREKSAENIESGCGRCSLRFGGW